MSKLNSHQRGVRAREQTPLQSAAEVSRAVSSSRPSVLKRFAISLIFCHLQYCFVISEVTGAQRGPGLFPLLPHPADRYQPQGGTSCLRPRAGLGVLACPTVSVPVALPRCVGLLGQGEGEPRPGCLSVLQMCCIYSAFRGFCRSPAVTREIFPPPPPRLCCITWLLFSCCCFFPPAFVDVGCCRGQVTGQDVLRLREVRTCE